MDQENAGDPAQVSVENASGKEMVKLQVDVPYDAYLNARHAALDSGRMSWKAYIAELLYLAAPFRVEKRGDPE